ncbi:coiled-coil domain-containing protein 86-like [Sycon ciliatum]|uniref:coiled-coil domain-containing protein 86-like n=1 Tax=Sycon ciliatum TaxID=27933 RepID=UPI0031F6B4E2|eukprot:scpid29035/ scgid12517/ Coiled-coil domain-containing protein 86; Cytokine-induced protein with coiled-coil domain
MAEVATPKTSASEPPRGRPKSGRVWKETQTARYSSVVDVKPLRTSWKKKQEQRAELKLIKQLDREAKEAKNKAKEDKRKREEENKRRREENEKKSQIVQKITRLDTLKRMKKNKKMQKKLQIR